MHQSTSHHSHLTLKCLATLILVTLPVRAALVGPGGGSGSQSSSASQSGQGSSSASAQAAQPPPIPLNLKTAAFCTRKPHTPKETAYRDACIAGRASLASRNLDAWAGVDNCQLSLAYNNSDWKVVQDLLIGFLADLSCHEASAPSPGMKWPPDTKKKPHDPCGPDLKDKCTKWFVDDGYSSFVFMNDQLQGPALSRVLVHDPKPEIYGNRVGAYRIYDIQLLNNLGISIVTHYQATATPNSFVTQIPGVFTQVAGVSKLLEPAAGGGGSATADDMEPPVQLTTADTLQAAGNLRDAATALTERHDSHFSEFSDAASALTTLSTQGAQPPANPASPEPSKLFDAVAQDIMNLPREIFKVNPQDLKRTISSINRALQQLEVRSVDVPDAFKNTIAWLPTKTAIPQVAVTDVMAFTTSLESSYLRSLGERAARFDLDFPDQLCQWGDNCSQPRGNCSDPANCGPLATINQQLRTRYGKCRFASLGWQFFVFAKGTDGTVRATLSDAKGQTPYGNYQVRLSARRLDDSASTSTVQCEPITAQRPPETSFLAWTAACPPATADVGVYDIQADLFGGKSGGVLLSTAHTSMPPNATEHLSLTGGNTVTIGATVTATAVLPPADLASQASSVVLNVFDAKIDSVHLLNSLPMQLQTSSTQPQTSSTQPQQSAAQQATFQVDIPTASLGIGDRIAVVEISGKDNAARSVASLPFTVGATGPASGGQGGAGSASGSDCATVSLEELKWMEGSGDLISSQEFTLDLVDLNSTYSALLQMSTPGAAGASAAQQPPTQYTLGSLTRWTFSLGLAGVIGRPLMNQPAKMSSSTVVPDTPTPVLTYVAAELHPVPYDETKFSPDFGERLRIIGGISLTPNPGFVLGGGFGLIRGLSIEGGVAFLLGNILPTGRSFTPPSDAGSRVARSLYSIGFAGFAYSFQ